MFYRRKILLSLLEALGGDLSPTDMQKHLFLFTRAQRTSAYDFVPFKYGCYSFGAAADKDPLIRQDHLLDSKTWKLRRGKKYAHLLDPRDLSTLLQHRQAYGHLRGDALIRQVYVNHPYYALNSEIAEGVLGRKQLASLRAKFLPPPEPALFTIGYEGKTIEAYVNELVQNGVTVLCDVRRNPVSRKYGFSKGLLERIVKGMGIDYVHVGELGIDSAKRQTLDSPADYDALFEQYRKTTLKENHDAVEFVADLVVRQKKRIALTCFEAKHSSCHRDSVADALQGLSNWEIPVTHI